MLVSTHYMDEAERCHEIAYIAYGELLAQGTIDEVIAQSHLRTYTVSGPDLQYLAEKLPASPASTWWRRSAPACMSPGRDAGGARPRPSRVSRRPRPALDASRSPRWRTFSSDLMARSQDNFQ